MFKKICMSTITAFIVIRYPGLVNPFDNFTRVRVVSFSFLNCLVFFGDTCIFKQRLIISAVHVPYFLVFHMSHNLGKWGKYVAFLFASFNLNLQKISYSKHATGKKRKLDHRENNLRYGINSPKYASLPFQFQCIFLNFCRWLSVT